MAVLPQQAPFLMPNMLAQTAFGLGNQQRDIESARAAAIAKVRAAALDRQAEAQRTTLQNTSDISDRLGSEFLVAMGSGGMAPGDLANTFRDAKRGTELGQAGMLASNINDLGAGASSLVDAGAQLPGPDLLAAMANQTPQNIRGVPTANQFSVAAAGAGADKPTDNLFIPTITTTDANGNTTTRDAPNTAPFQDRASMEVYKLKNALPLGSTYGDRLGFRGQTTTVPPANIPDPNAGKGTAITKDDPNISIDPNEDPTNNADDAPQAAGSARDREVARVAASQNLAGDVTSEQPQPPSTTVTNADGSTTTTITKTDGNYTIQRNLDGSGTVTVPDGRTVPFSAGQNINVGS